ncbi:unnamed protein product [Prorocentrum cordatum]|uniref:Uncharacterized protein n=1 Tax=Prorocentrum cordatum TaxID=2364126 RepID=A0ABN9QY91_9DINO|nr:unnamed protein product [Polarella glacialis]
MCASPPPIKHEPGREPGRGAAASCSRPPPSGGPVPALRGGLRTSSSATANRGRGSATAARTRSTSSGREGCREDRTTAACLAASSPAALLALGAVVFFFSGPGAPRGGHGGETEMT